MCVCFRCSVSSFSARTWQVGFGGGRQAGQEGLGGWQAGQEGLGGQQHYHPTYLGGKQGGGQDISRRAGGQREKEEREKEV